MDKQKIKMVGMEECLSMVEKLHSKSITPISVLDADEIPEIEEESSVADLKLKIKELDIELDHLRYEYNKLQQQYNRLNSSIVEVSEEQPVTIEEWCSDECQELNQRSDVSYILKSELCSLRTELKNIMDPQFNCTEDDIAELKQQITDHELLITNFNYDKHAALRSAIIERRKKLFFRRNNNG